MLMPMYEKRTMQPKTLELLCCHNLNQETEQEMSLFQ